MPETLTLRELADEALALDELIAMDHGEWTDDHDALATELTEKLLRKTDSFASYVKDLEARAEIVRAEEKRLAERRRRLEADLDRLGNYAKIVMARMGHEKLTGSLHTIAIRKNPPSVEVDATLLAADPELRETFITTEIVTKVDRAGVKRCLLQGIDVPGCKLVYSTRMEVR